MGVGLGDAPPLCPSHGVPHGPVVTSLPLLFSTPAEHQLARRLLLLESSFCTPQPSSSSRVLLVGWWFALYCQPVRKQDAVVVSDNTHKLSHSVRSTVELALCQVTSFIQFFFFTAYVPCCTHTEPYHVYITVSGCACLFRRTFYRF